MGHWNKVLRFVWILNIFSSALAARKPQPKFWTHVCFSFQVTNLCTISSWFYLLFLNLLFNFSYFFSPMTLRSHGMHFTNCLKLYLIMVGIITDAYRKTISMYFPSPSSYLHWLLGNSEALNSSSPKRKDFANKGPHSQSYGFSTSHVRVGHKEGWASKNWCFWTVGLGNILESPLDSKGIKQISPKGNQPWIFIGRTDAETGAPIFWPPDAKNNSLEKTLMLGKIEGRREREWQRMIWLDSITTNSVVMSLSKL